MFEFLIKQQKALWRILSVFLVLVLIVIGAERSQPGEFLYPISSFIDTARTALVLTPTQSMRAHLHLADKRYHQLTGLMEQHAKPELVAQSANSLSEQVVLAENELRVVKMQGKNIAELKEELCDPLMTYQPRLRTLMNNPDQYGAAYADSVSHAQKTIDEAIAQADMW